MCNKVFIVHVDEMTCDINIPLDVCRYRQSIGKGKQQGGVWGCQPEVLITCPFHGEEFKGRELIILMVRGYIKPACAWPRTEAWYVAGSPLSREVPCKLL